MEVDYIIVGGGIAGCSLAMELLAENQSIALIDDLAPSASSRIAAGVLNPIVPKRVTLSWNAREIFRGLQHYYESQEQKLQTRFFFPMKLIQVHASEQEAKMWRIQCNKEEVAEFVEPRSEITAFGIHTPFGYSEIKHGGRLHVQTFCDAVLAEIRRENVVVDETFYHAYLQFTEDPIYLFRYKDILAKGIVFCEGTGIENNPFFEQIPITKSWGDILKISTEAEVEEDTVFKQKHWVLPVGNREFLAGSNFLLDKGDIISENAAVNEIFSHTKKWFPAEKLISHQRGARPVVPDRRPVLGEHRQYKGMYLFNGLGTKGCSLVTWLSPKMSSYILRRSPLPDEVLLQRFLF